MLPWMTRAMASVRGGLRTSSNVALWRRLAGREKLAEAGTGENGYSFD